MDFFTLFSPDGVISETDMVCTVIALVLLYIFVGICVGFDGGLTAISFVTLMLLAEMATPLLVIVDTATALYATQLLRKGTDWRSAIALIIFLFLKIPIDLYASSYLPDHFMKVGLGGFLILCSLYSMFIPRLPIYDRSWIVASIGAVAGALGAAFSTSGSPMVIYGVLRSLGPATSRGTLNAFFTANNIAVIGELTTSEISIVSTFRLVLFCIPITIPGSLVGQYVHKRISAKVFHVVIFSLLAASGSMLIGDVLGISTTAVPLPPFTLLVILQLAFGKEMVTIHRTEESR